MYQTLQGLLDSVDRSVDELVELHQALVRIPTINTGSPDSGNEIEACRLLEERFRAEGISTLTLESHPNRGNLLAFMGNQAHPRLLLMSHLDVVPVEDESRWQLPPFSAAIVDGKIYGRGSDDAKSLVSTGAMTLILLKRAGVALDGELRFLAAADEEAGGRYGIAWLSEQHPDEIRADWAINEGGGMPVQTPAGPAYRLSVGEKGRLEAHFRFRGSGGHAARPWQADNALLKLGQVLERLNAYQPQIDLSLPIFQHLAVLGIQEQPTPDNLEQLLEALRHNNPSLATTLTALSRMSITPTMATAGIKSNSVPAVAELTCDIRTLPQQSPEYVKAELDRLVDGLEDVEVTLEVTAIANASPYDSPFVAQLRRATELALDRQDIGWIPALTIGFTDSRCVRPLGTQVYGFSPITPTSDTVRAGVHGVDEAMEIDNLVLRTRMQVALAYLTLGAGG